MPCRAVPCRAAATARHYLQAYDICGGVRVVISHERPFSGLPTEIDQDKLSDCDGEVEAAPAVPPAASGPPGGGSSRGYIPKYAGLRDDVEWTDWSDRGWEKRRAWLKGGTPPQWDAPKVPLVGSELEELTAFAKPWQSNVASRVIGVGQTGEELSHLSAGADEDGLRRVQEAYHPWRSGATVTIVGLQSAAGQLLNGRQGVLQKGLPNGKLELG